MNIYNSLKSYSNFNDTFQENNYVNLPEDWFVIITDVESSTLWVNKGMYKEVNTIGAACIGAVKSIEDEIPYVFGGDGASFVVPPDYKEVVLNKLIKIKNTAKKNYNIILRIGCVPVKDIYDRGCSLKIAKFEVSNNQYLAKFSGGGLSFADLLIKKNKKYQINKEELNTGDFDNLSCRWKPIPNTKGTIMTLIVQMDSMKKYNELFKELNQILDLSSHELNPVKIGYMKYKSLFRIIKDEFGYESKINSIKSFKRLISIIFCYFVFSRLKNYLPKSFIKKFDDYKNTMDKYSDYRKFDDVLRIVVDCSLNEVNNIKKLLNNFEGVSYGIHLSDYALMTCLVKSLNDGEHIHFIDGAEGGYTMAAVQLKKQLLNKKNVA